MPDLRNRQQHMRGGRVLVNGHIYQIDAEGVVLGVSDEDAYKLLQNPLWQTYRARPGAPKRHPVVEPTPVPESRTEAPEPALESPSSPEKPKRGRGRPRAEAKT